MKYAQSIRVLSAVLCLGLRTYRGRTGPATRSIVDRERLCSAVRRCRRRWVLKNEPVPRIWRCLFRPGRPGVCRQPRGGDGVRLRRGHAKDRYEQALAVVGPSRDPRGHSRGQKVNVSGRAQLRRAHANDRVDKKCMALYSGARLCQQHPLSQTALLLRQVCPGEIGSGCTLSPYLVDRSRILPFS